MFLIKATAIFILNIISHIEAKDTIFIEIPKTLSLPSVESWICVRHFLNRSVYVNIISINMKNNFQLLYKCTWFQRYNVSMTQSIWRVQSILWMEVIKKKFPEITFQNGDDPLPINDNAVLVALDADSAGKSRRDFCYRYLLFRLNL